MNSLMKLTIIRSAVIALVLSTGVVTTANAAVTRLSGVDRYSTADAIVEFGWKEGAETAVLASGLDANTVDALTVAPLAKAKNAPVVLVNPRDSVATIVSKFTALNTKVVFIANGTGVIPLEVEEGLKNSGIVAVNRLGGANRYETALNIARTIGASTSIVVASGENAHLVDSLSIAPIAAAKGMPIFLAGSSLDEATSNYIKSLGAKTTYIIGEADTVSDAIAKMLPGVIRLAGTTRYETNANVVDNFKADSSLNYNNIFIASGENANLIDALAGAPLAASKGAPIIFVHDTINPDVNTLLKSIVTPTTNIIELGGTSALTVAAAGAINTIQIETGVVIFPDENLEKAIRKTIQKHDGDILIGDVNKITEMRAEEMNITNLTGIENLTNLIRLNISTNKISDIEPLKSLTNLVTLSLDRNQIINLEPLKYLTKLGDLRLIDNQIINIEPLAALTNLSALYLNNNKIINIDPLKVLTKLTTLDLINNQIINIDPLKTLTRMRSLQLMYNQITNISALKGLTYLNILTLNNNLISNIDPLVGLTNLTALFIYNNNISESEASIRKKFAGLTKLNQFYITEEESLSAMGA